MIQPQGDDEVRPVEAKLRALDPGLCIRWNPTARHRRTAYHDVMGKLIVDEKNEGRFQVVKRSLDENDPEREVVIYTVEFDGEREGEYRPVGDWLVDFFRKWDSANAHYREEWEKEWAHHDQVAATARDWQDEPAALEGLDKMYLKMRERHTHYPGRGADFNVNSN